MAEKSRARQRAERKGRLSEWLAMLFLRLKAYRILARNFRSRNGEIDLIARRGDVIILVEVKARASHETAREAVHWKNRRRIERAGQDFLSRHPALMRYGLRYDIITLVGLSLTHHRDAWRYGE